MPQPKKGARLGSGPSHQRLMLSNLAQSLFEHERVKTTEAKAKLLRPFAERLITKAKDGSVHQRRQVLATIENRAVVHKLFSDIAPRFGDRNGGYTRILKLGPRNGDGAPMALIELVEDAAVLPAAETTGRTGRRLSRPNRRRGLPQDKPVRSRAADAGAAGSGLGLESAEDEAPTDTGDEAAGTETVTEEQQTQEAAVEVESATEAGAEEQQTQGEKTQGEQTQEAEAVETPEAGGDESSAGDEETAPQDGPDAGTSSQGEPGESAEDTEPKA